MPKKTASDASRRLPPSFHPLVAEWFGARYGEPTPVQSEAWPLIAAGRHVLASAPTGSGKTLTAFLDALSRFASGSLPAEGLSVLYISPLKALNEDIRRNLAEPLAELRAWFAANGAEFPRVTVATRSGDTTASERRRIAARPPSILCTTPESLAIMLASRQGLSTLRAVRLVILDEVHAVLGSKRGSMLACSVGRLALAAGEFQRVALSATVKPFGEAARFVGGRRLFRDSSGAADYEERPVAVVAPATAKRYEFEVAWPPAPIAGGPGASFDEEAGAPAGRYGAIAADIVARLSGGRTIVVFVDARRRAERLAARINELAGEGTAWAHHGSLSREVRSAVEARLKKGELRCVVATGTLELGIDVGSIDLVAMAGAPTRADQILQRAGRAGHGVGLPSKAVIYPFHGLDLLAAAAGVGAALEGDVDPIRPPSCPLDALAQVILAMCLFEDRAIDELYDELRSFPPYAELSRGDFDDVVGLLSGRYEGARLKELSPRLRIDPERGSARAKDGAAMLLYSSGGAIPDRGAYEMKLASDGSKIGELDEEFVFERRIGNSFMFGAQSWRIVAIDEESVGVVPIGRDADFMPFWKADKAPRGESISRRMLEACAAFEAGPEDFGSRLRRSLGFSESAASELEGFLASQARLGSARGSPTLPGPARAAAELYANPTGHSGVSTVMVHTLRGSAVNEALSLALAQTIGADSGVAVDRLASDDSVTLGLPLAGLDEARAAWFSAVRRLAEPGRLAAALAAALPASGAFGAAFRENAGRALLLPRSGFGKRTPLWITRLRAKRLFERASGFPDFPIIRETWKTVLATRLDVSGAEAFCSGVADGSLLVSDSSPAAPGPFARSSGWAFVNRYLYEGDELGRPAGSAGDQAVRDALLDPAARPRVPPELVAEYGRKVRRELPGWAPESADELADWVEEREAIPLDEWDELIGAVPAELAAEARLAISKPGAGAGLLSRVVAHRFPGSSIGVALRRERVAALEAGLKADPSVVVAAWLSNSGPVSLNRLAAVFGFESGAAAAASLRGAALAAAPGGAAEGAQASVVLIDDLGAVGGEPGEPGAIARDALESLIRLARRSARLEVRPRPAEELFGFVASLQGLRDMRAEYGHPTGAPAGDAGQAAPGLGAAAVPAAGGRQATEAALRRMSGYTAPAGLWETELLPARVPGYRPEYLDGLLESGAFVWYGAGEGLVAFCPADEYEAFAAHGSSALLEPGAAPADMWALMDRSGKSLAEAEDSLWAEAWAGLISSTSFEPVRKAAAFGFKRLTIGSVSGRGGASAGVGGGRKGSLPMGPGGLSRMPLSLRGRWKAGAPVPGLWFPLSVGGPAERDGAYSLELQTVRVRALVRRYGIIAPSIVAREPQGSSWGRLFRAVRRMEMSGELAAGRFFDGVSGPQFIGRDALALFESGAGYAAMAAVSVNAVDPSVAPGWPAAPEARIGPSEAGGPGALARTASCRVSASGGRLACVSRRSYKDLELYLEPDDPALPAALAFLVEARRREVAPERRIVVETVNGQAAAGSRWAGALAALGFEADRGSMTLW